MIYTVTFNPSLDYIVSVSDFKLGLTNRTDSELLLPGGKGINVSTVLQNLGIANTAFGFTAGFVGEEVRKEVEQLGVKAEFISLDEGVSRINLKLKSIDGTEINGSGTEDPREAVDALMTQLDRLGRMIRWCWLEVFQRRCRMIFIRRLWSAWMAGTSGLLWTRPRICCSMCWGTIHF